MIWFRLHTELLHDPKVQRLSPEHFKIYINCLCYTGQSDKGGTIGNISDVSFALRETESSVSSAFHQFEKTGLIAPIETDSETFHVPQWNKKQYKSDNSTERVRKFRANKKRSETVTVTAPEADTEADTEAEKKAKASPKKFGPQEVINLWNKECPSLGKVIKITSTRRQKINKRTKEDFGELKDWKNYFGVYETSNFLAGRAGNWKATFDWSLEPRNMVKVIEGNYSNDANGFNVLEYSKRKRENEN